MMLRLLLKIRNINVVFLIAVFFLTSCSIFKPVKNQGEPRFLGYYFSDRDGNKITGQVSPKQKFIYLIVETENAIGEKVTIQMDEKSETDYIYKGRYLAEKLRFKIHKDKEKLKLYIYNHKNKRHRRLKEKAMQLNQ